MPKGKQPDCLSETTAKTAGEATRVILDKCKALDALPNHEFAKHLASVPLTKDREPTRQVDMTLPTATDVALDQVINKLKKRAKKR